METLQELVNIAIDDLKDWIEDNPGEDPEDMIHEMTDSCVPIYDGDILELAARHNFLATREPDIGPAFDGRPTPVNIIAANIYEYVYDELWNWWRKYESENL